MKKTIFLVLFLSFVHTIAISQILYSEKFDGLNLGNVGTDITGTNKGQADFYTKAYGASGVKNEDFRIELEPNRGKVLVIEGPKTNFREEIAYRTRKVEKNLKGLWKNRNIQNNILKCEYYFYTEKKLYHKKKEVLIQALAVDECKLSDIIFDGYSKKMDFGHNALLNLLSDRWVKLITYLDFTNSDVYFEIPDFNYTVKSKIELLPGSGDIHEFGFVAFTLQGEDNFFENYKAKFDDIMVSAVNTLPKLNIHDLDSSKFNIFPNPANDIIKITNQENIEITEIIIYDLSGRIMQENKFNNEKDIQVDVSNLNSGIYLFQIKTNVGTSLIRVVKK